MRDSHPDRMIARGVPEEGVRLAEKRLFDELQIPLPHYRAVDSLDDLGLG